MKDFMISKMISKPRPLTGFLLALEIVVMDQVSKWLMLEYVLKEHVQPHGPRSGFIDWILSAPPRLPPMSVEVWPFFNFVMVWNEGISFGLFQGSTVWILVGLAAAITIAFSVMIFKATHWLPLISMAMVIGGAVGNIIDRIRFGAVADFLDFHAFGYHYPAFNVADCGITLGIAMLVIDGLFLEPKRTKKLHAKQSVAA